MIFLNIGSGARKRRAQQEEWARTRRAEKWTANYGPGRCACGGNLSLETHKNHTPQTCIR